MQSNLFLCGKYRPSAMLFLALLVIVSFQLSIGQPGEDVKILIEEKNVLSPPYFNIATGKKIDTTSTCGTESPELFCKLTGGTNFEFSSSLHQGQVCDICDASDLDKSHSINNAIDGTEKWWQSPPLSRGSEYNHVNVTIHLGQVFHVAYVLLKFANSPRAGTWVLERSSDNGKTFQPWQYFANTDSDCYNQFGMSSLEEITRDDSVICTSDYSGVVPLENGEVIVSMIKGRPGAQNFSYATVLQEWSKATDIRLRLLRTKTLLGHLMAVSEQDPTVTRRYYYSIKDISIGGRCVCNGHADICEPDPLDQYKLKCHCQHNTCGDSCERCCPGFVQKAWRVAVPESTNECEACNCFGHSVDCLYDEEVARRRLSLDIHGNYDGGGVCQNCQHNTAGINCEQCASGFWRPENSNPLDPNGCQPCDCDSQYTVGSCEPNTGRCYCRPQYAGDRCDRCAPGYHEFPECRPCDCYYNGTLNEVCVPFDDGCPCKYNFAGMYCRECAPGFYDFPNCQACLCNGEGVSSDVCDIYSGKCPCLEGFSGQRCEECAPGYYGYPLCQRCRCSDLGTTDEVCDRRTGECVCGNKYSGPSCDDCKSGFYGFPQCQECQCTQPGSINNICDSSSGRCSCTNNYQGERCEQCAPEFYSYPNCLPCACNIRGSLRTTCDQVTGKCVCRENIGGRACDACNSNYFNFPRCEECSCDTRGIVPSSPGVCLAFTSGQCECKDNVIGRNCDLCKPLYYDLARGCISCNCFLPGTLDGVGECNEQSGSCWCKPFTCSQRCSQCEDGFYSLQQLNYFGCLSCQCDVGGSMSSLCNKNSGQCPCKEGVGGRRCNRAKNGYYHPTLYQYQYELEYSHTPEGGPARAGFDESLFSNYSMNGYAQFSTVQDTVVVPVNVLNDGLYRIVLRYVNRGSNPVKANVTLSPVNVEEDGIVQSMEVTLGRYSSPRQITGAQPLVLNRGKWNFLLAAPPGVLVDYFVLIPSQYYEPSLLDLSVTEPCSPVPELSNKQCVMFSHLDLGSFTNQDLLQGSSRNNLAYPSTSHPKMRYLSAVSGVSDDSEVTVDLNLPVSGKYVLVLEYASTENKFQKSQVSVNDGAGNSYSAKFNIYSCLYLFLCRQVALGPSNEVAVFEASVPKFKVHLQTETGGAFYVKTLTAIPLEDWNMGLVEPKPRCITVQGPEFERCLQSTYNLPSGITQFPAIGTSSATNNSVTRPPTVSDEPLAFLNGQNTSNVSGMTLQIPMLLPPGRYIFIVRYYNPYHTRFTPDVVIYGGIASNGGVNLTYCPNENGCLGVVVTDSGQSVIDITVPSSTFTLVSPPEKSFWIQDVYAIPERLYKPSILDFSPSDKSSDFVRECGQESYDRNGADSFEFCRDSVFSLTVDYNNGAFPCNCSGAGTVGGGDTVCEAFGGQCPCKPNVIGRQCDRCKSGHYNYPNCIPCDCNGLLCDQITGTCICPPNTVNTTCNECLPFTHSYHPLLGCVACECNVQGVVDANNRGCDPDSGQCYCKNHITGQRCDQCEPGYFGFPDCQQCTCDSRGSASSQCDPISGQCLCKENVEGLQCDRCKMGSFFLDENNDEGCTQCFCFGASPVAECHSSQYPATEVLNMDQWRVPNINNPVIVSVNNKGIEGVEVDVGASGGLIDPSSAIYWAAPADYLGDKISSYGGDLRYSVYWQFQSSRRGDEENFNSAPEPLLSAPADLVLTGNHLRIGWKNPIFTQNNSLKLTEVNFKHIPSGNVVKREEMMMVLADLNSLHIRASPSNDATFIALYNVVMTTTEYSLPIGSAPSISTVEECLCPEGYIGHSCQLCDDGYYREIRGPYLGYCRECNCYGHCEECDNAGLVNSGECLHNTGGPNCGVCNDGYIGNATSGEVDACTPCPCPRSSEDGNFADTCEYDQQGEVICYCQAGYTGDHCEQCAPGYFGNPTSVGGTCQPCNCHGNLDPNLIMEDCDPDTGACTDCVYNTGGKYCERCADGYYGDAIIAKNCTKCNCDECGTHVCDHNQGYCACKPHVIGQKCSACEPGFYGFELCEGCKSCDCAEGALGSECNVDTGQCRCSPNVVGIRCDKCAPGFWNYGSSGCEPCNCHNQGQCNPINGLCECPPGVTGAQCDQCELARHVLEPEASECSRCDSCIDDLLDEIEPLTETVLESISKLRNTSIGVSARKRLKSLQDRAQQIDVILEQDEHFLSIANFITSDIADVTMAVSGSGMVDPTLPLGGNEGDISLLEIQISDTEAAVSGMCNHTNALFDLTKSTKTRSDNLKNSSMILSKSASEFQEEIVELLNELSSDSSGDADDYLMKLNQAEMILERMKERNMSPLQRMANVELLEALNLLRRIEEGFIYPAGNISSQTEELLDKFSTIHSKLEDIRIKMNLATNLSNHATTINSVNRKDLAAIQQLINEINSQVTMATSDVDDALQLLNTSQNLIDGPITGGIVEVGGLKAAVQQQAEILRPIAEKLKEDLERFRPFVNESIWKAGNLSADADSLEQLAQMQFNDSALKVINRYQEIMNLLQEADAAADSALMAAEKAKRDVADRDIQKEANAAAARSSNLLTSAQDLRDNDIEVLKMNMETANNNLTDAETKKDELSNSIYRLTSEISNLELDDIDEGVADVNASVFMADQSSQSANDEANELEALLERSSEDVDLSGNLNEIETILNDLSTSVGLMDEKKKQVVAKATEITDRQRSLNIEEQIINIRKRIKLTRGVANMIKDAMKFSKNRDSGSSSVTLRTPFALQDIDSNVEIDFTIRIEEDSPNSQILYFGDQSENGDYLSLETVGGTVRYKFKVGDDVGTLQSQVRVDRDFWSTISIVRWGNYGKLIVTFPVDSRGDELGPERSIEIVSGETGGTGFLSTMNTTNSILILGNLHPNQQPPGNEGFGVGNLCIRDFYLNNETVGLWNFKTYTGPEEGQSCPSNDLPESIYGSNNNYWRFSGVGSYVRIQKSNYSFLTGRGRKAHYIGFKLETLQDNSLVYLIGNSLHQFMAVEIKNGQLVLHWNFNETAQPKQMVFFHDNIAKSRVRPAFKTGLIPGNNRIVVQDEIQNRLVLNEEYTGVADPQGDIWFGGVWPYDVNRDLLEYLNNSGVSYRGCVDNLNINAQRVILESVLENTGVTRGCIKERVKTLTLQGNEYVGFVSNHGRVRNIDGGFAMLTDSPIGTMMTVMDDQASTSTKRNNFSTTERYQDSTVNINKEELADIINSVGTDHETSLNQKPNITKELETDDEGVLPNEEARLTGDAVVNGNGNVLPLILIVIGIIVAVVLVGAIISSCIKSQHTPLVSSTQAQISPEETPLNEMQAQRIAQMDW